LKAQLEISGGPGKGAIFEATFTPKKGRLIRVRVQKDLARPAKHSDAQR
jgi:hypothetical protein